MITICALIVLDWLYALSILLHSIFIELRAALQPAAGRNRNSYGHEQVWLPPELWVEALAWMSPKQLTKCQLASARLRDIVDRHRVRLPRRQFNHRVALNTAIASFRHDYNVLFQLLMFNRILPFNDVHLLLIMCFYTILFPFYKRFLQFVPESVIGAIWPRHSRFIVRNCEMMNKAYQDRQFFEEPYDFISFLAMNVTNLIMLVLRNIVVWRLHKLFY